MEFSRLPQGGSVLPQLPSSLACREAGRAQDLLLLATCRQTALWKLTGEGHAVCVRVCRLLGFCPHPVLCPDLDSFQGTSTS